MALVLSLASSGLCVVLTSHPPETPCQKDRPVDNGIGLKTTGQSKMLPCHSRDGQPLFLFPDAATGRFKTEDRQPAQSAGPAAVSAPLTLLPDTRPFKAFYDFSLAFYPPPLFYLHCSLIC